MRFFLSVTALCVAMAVSCAAADSHYHLVENWGQSKWAPVTGVDVDAQDNLFVFQRS